MTLPDLTIQLMSLVGRSLTDKAVKSILEAAGLPLTTRMEDQADPEFGVAYTAFKFLIDGKRKLGVSMVRFFNQGEKLHIAGLGREVTFSQYRGRLPRGLTFKDTRQVVRDKLGAPVDTWDDHDDWRIEGRNLVVFYTKEKIASVMWGGV